MTEKFSRANRINIPKRRVRKRLKGRKPAETLAPTLERKLQGEVDLVPKPIADSRGGYGQPYRAIDILAAWRRSQAISEAMYDAGRRFQACFAAGQLVALAAADFGEQKVSGARKLLMAEHIEVARDRVWRDLLAVGGISSPGGSCLWHVLGWEVPLKVWAIEQRHCSPAAATGVLIAALGVLARR